MRRAISVANVFSSKFQTLDLPPEWSAAIGRPEVSGTWFVYGPPKNGKTSFTMMLCKCLAAIKRVVYNSVEEGFCETTKEAVHRAGMTPGESKFVLLDKEELEDLILRLKKHKSPDVIVLDSIQFMDLRWSDYKRLKSEFPNKLFIYISHIDGKQPDGITARRIWRDASVIFRVEGFMAFPVSRYGGGSNITVSEEKAKEYWGLDSEKTNN